MFISTAVALLAFSSPQPWFLVSSPSPTASSFEISLADRLPLVAEQPLPRSPPTLPHPMAITPSFPPDAATASLVEDRPFIAFGGCNSTAGDRLLFAFGHCNQLSTAASRPCRQRWRDRRATGGAHNTGKQRTVMLPGVFEIMSTVVPVTAEDDRIHKYDIPAGNCFAHFEVQFKFFGEGGGCAGQTYRPYFESPVKKGVAMPVMGGLKAMMMSG